MQEKFWLLAGAAMLAMPALMPGRAMAADAAANAYNDADASTIIVSAPTPLSHAASDERVSIDARAIRESHAISLSDALARTAPGVAIAETQGNPLQPDLSFRGYTASPLLGTPQGIAVYVDGIRANQPFGDVVSWDLMPTIALSSSRLVTGAAPQFGRNALGGALAIETKSGLSDPGLSLAISGGSAGRARGSMEVGGHSDNGLHWYGAMEGLREDGWRYASASRSWKGFAKLGWEGAHDGVALTFAHADSTLNGNGLQEYRLLAADWRSV
ncbi:MAG TPA: Plug domain-containing protein, partial [Novosphingobium sp.]|nr:Plug domain-containing protein [Novosphingobium sp.]